MARPAKTRKPAAPVALTVYVHPDTIKGLEAFQAAAMRPKSQACDFLLLLGLERHVETGKVQPDAAKPIAPRNQTKPEGTPPARRGRPPKAAVEATPAKAPAKRGRPPKATAAAAKAPAKRGRPPKATAAKVATPAKRGRPKKKA